MHETFMRSALQQAEIALSQGEVPVGAVIVYNGEIIASCHNTKEKNCDPTAHAEINAIRKACQSLSSWRLSGCTLYVTLEPCPMCACAIRQARMKEVVFGAADPTGGGCGSKCDMLNLPGLGESVSIIGGVMQKQSIDLLHSFFKLKRKK